MTMEPLRSEENDLRRIVRAISQLIQGRSNGHGNFSLTDDNSATSTQVTAINCKDVSHINITPQNANAANMVRTADVYVVPGNGSFTVYHAATSSTCNFSFSING